MDREIVVGYAGPTLGKLGYRGSKGGFGYGLYFTGGRLVGISYKRIVSRANLPGYILAATGFGILGLLPVYFIITKPAPDATIPIWIGVLVLIMLGSLFASLYFLQGRSPRQAEIQIRHAESTALGNLSGLQYDVSLDRINISQVLIDFLQISILMKNGEWFLFGLQYGPEDPARPQLISLFRQYCLQSPPVTMYVRNQNKQWDLISTAEGLA